MRPSKCFLHVICDRASYNCPLTLSGVEAGTQDPSHHLLSLLPVKATSWRSGHMSGSPFFSLCWTDFKKPSVLFCTFLPSLGLFFSGPGPAPLPPVYTHTPFLSLRSKFVHPPSCGRSSFFFFPSNILTSTFLICRIWIFWFVGQQLQAPRMVS